MQCNFLTSSDFVKSICQSLEQSFLISTMPYLTSDFTHAQIKKADRKKNCTKSGLHAGLHCYLRQHVVAICINMYLDIWYPITLIVLNALQMLLLFTIPIMGDLSW